MQALYPRDAGDDSLYPLLARVARELKDSPAMSRRQPAAKLDDQDGYNEQSSV